MMKVLLDARTIRNAAIAQCVCWIENIIDCERNFYSFAEGNKPSNKISMSVKFSSQKAVFACSAHISEEQTANLLET